MERRFLQVDVFGRRPYAGNPLAVVLDAEGLGDAEMQRVAQWTNLSETTFVLPPADPEADYRVRIFTPSRELPFAGHPTLGTAFAWLTSGGEPRKSDLVVQECAAGLIPVRRDADRLAFAAPPLMREGPVEESVVAEIVASLGVERAAVVDAQWADNGPGWVAVLLGTADEVLAVRPGPVTYKIGVVGPHPAGASPAWEVRAFVPSAGGTTEDPVTGSLNASVAQWLIGTGRAEPSYVAAQGTAIGREGRIHIHRDPDGTIWVGGQTTPQITGQIDL
ncbi:MAG: PhzF family phenazine biosynthesis isomerase [Streptosporangiales bacterium]|nr:PhzF family phenazine biosynthesis isomerase [Streptosporangiales bacterium]